MDKTPVENLNETKLKKILINFERKFDENQKLRIKYADDPNKFASSETELFAALDELQSVSIQPELYHILIAKQTLSTLMSLLMHENPDISAKVIVMIQEFTDLDEVEQQDSTGALIKALQKENIVDLIVANLDRLDEANKDEAQAINNSLAIIDNLIDFDSVFATTGNKLLIEWMVRRLKKNVEFNAIKLSISELLSVLLLNSPENKKLLGECNGIDVLLRQVAFYSRVAPVTGDEHEFLEQTINCLCTGILDCDENREAFHKEEGVELVELILREKRPCVKKSNIKLSTLKLFNHVLTTERNKDPIVSQCCERFVQVLGLRVLFPIFNQPKIVLSEKVRKREYYQTLDEIEEHSSAIVLALLKYCQDSQSIQRVLVKFAESNFEKLDRLLDLHGKYFRIVANRADKDEEKAIDESDDEDEEDRRMKMKEEQSKSSVYFTLRTIDYIILLSCYLSNHFETYDPNSGETFTSRIGKLLTRKPELKHQIMLEAKKHIDEVNGSLEEQNSLQLLVNYFESIGKSSTAAAAAAVVEGTETTRTKTIVESK